MDPDLPAGWSTGTVDADGVSLRYYRGGDGPPVVAAHGFYGNGRCWLPVATALTDLGREVVTYDARAHGLSDAPDAGYAVEDRVADLVGLLAELDLADPVLLGHSMGAATVAWTAAERPDRVRGAVLEDPVGVHDATPDVDADERVAAVHDQLDEVAGRSVEELIADEYREYDPDWARRLAVAATECRPQVAEYAREAYPEPLGAVFDRIEVPTLVLRSDCPVEDRVRDLDAADALSEGRLVHVHDAGHYVFHDEYDAATAELESFLARL